ncbi:MAG: phosphatidylglycerophosphatase A [Zoogloeaceae bacterium]|jgi:phosphatidylglycerophosphatase A|nr:phosphatidylglycerophosphatase A [Zoogloeaceae bacterium]
MKKAALPPPIRFLLAHPAHFFALGCGSGLAPRAPGTFGTLFAWGSFVLLRPLCGAWGFALLLAIAFVLGIWMIHLTGQRLNEPDHGSIVWDEIVPFWAVLFLMPGDWRWQALAFLLFRFFDITKPQPARWFDRNMKNGLGVMMDDVVAAAYTVLTLMLMQWIHS